jgi:hypothetical protein
VEDLSSKLPSDPVTALAPTSQAGGNMTSSSKYAMTAPGSPPTDPVPPASEQGNPKITAETHTRTVLHPEASPKAGNPYPNTGGPKWVRSGNTTVKES